MEIRKSIMLRMRCSCVMLLFFIGVISGSAVLSFDSSEWGPWTVVSNVHSGLEVRMRKGAYDEKRNRNWWQIQFRNNYSEGIVFGFGLTRAEDRNQCVIDHLRNLPPKKVSEITEALLDDRYTWQVCVDNVERKQ